MLFSLGNQGNVLSFFAVLLKGASLGVLTFNNKDHALLFTILLPGVSLQFFLFVTTCIRGKPCRSLLYYYKGRALPFLSLQLAKGKTFLPFFLFNFSIIHYITGLFFILYLQGAFFTLNYYS